MVFVDLAVNTPLKLVVSYCDNAPISSVLVLAMVIYLHICCLCN